MQHRYLLPLLLPAFLFAACREDQSPTAPVEHGDMAESHTPGHKVVNSLADPGDGVCTAAQCTLREAIRDPQSTEISFAPGLDGPITLARPSAGGGTLVIQKALTITGPSTGILIRRLGTDPAFRIIRIPVPVKVELTRLRIRGGSTDRAGGGILNFGRLVLTSCTVAGNSGGAIDNHGALTVANSTVARNSGAGIINRNNVSLTLARSTVEGNSGRGIVNLGGTLAVSHSTVAGNSEGGISENRGTATVTDSRIVGNTTIGRGGGISVFQGGLTLTNSTVEGNSASEGGGISNREGSRSTIVKSTIANNSASSVAGGIYNSVRVRAAALVTLTNSTVSGNSARFGGGILNEGAEVVAILSLTNSTVTRNSSSFGGGGGIAQASQSSLELVNSLVAQNSAPSGPDLHNPGGGLSPVGARFSLIGDGSGSGVTNTDGNQVGSASEPIDPRLGPLAANGGPTRTHALLLGSPAIDAASTPACPTTDQRGVLRPQGAACDIGSFERE